MNRYTTVVDLAKRPGKGGIDDVLIKCTKQNSRAIHKNYNIAKFRTKVGR